jgi:hypothetical protein
MIPLSKEKSKRATFYPFTLAIKQSMCRRNEEICEVNIMTIKAWREKFTVTCGENEGV